MFIGLAGLPFLLLFALSFLGFFLPPPKHRPDGLFYGLCLFLLHLVCLFLILGGCLAWSSGQPRLGGTLVAASVLAACGVLANTFWVRGAARKFPEGMDAEDRREALHRLHRRLWGVLLGGILCLYGLPMAMLLWSRMDTTSKVQDLP